MKKLGDKCSACCEKRRLFLVNGALVCAACDQTALWPSVQNAT